MLCLVGGQVPLLLRYFGSSTFPGVIRLHFAGGRFPQEHLGALRKVFPEAVIFNNYGCAEAMPRLALRRAEAAEQAQNVGWTLPGVEMTTDADGRLLFRSPFGAVALGDDAGFSNVDATTWVPTGDLGAQAADGHWEIHGRHGDVFKRYGEKISVAAVLSTVRANWGGQAEAYREQDRSGEAGYVIVVAPRPAEDETQAVLRELGLKHPRAHWPLRLESLAALPLLPNGKIDRGSLASQTKAETHWRQRI
jgi:long-chain acyl-CoA synthetase